MSMGATLRFTRSRGKGDDSEGTLHYASPHVAPLCRAVSRS